MRNSPRTISDWFYLLWDFVFFALFVSPIWVLPFAGAVNEDVGNLIAMIVYVVIFTFVCLLIFGQVSGLSLRLRQRPATSRTKGR